MSEIRTRDRIIWTNKTGDVLYLTAKFTISFY